MTFVLLQGEHSKKGSQLLDNQRENDETEKIQHC